MEDFVDDWLRKIHYKNHSANLIGLITIYSKKVTTSAEKVTIS